MPSHHIPVERIECGLTGRHVEVCGGVVIQHRAAQLRESARAAYVAGDCTEIASRVLHCIILVLV